MSNFDPNSYKNMPINNKPIILIMCFGLNGFFYVTAKGIATPIINKKEGKIKSAGVSPFH